MLYLQKIKDYILSAFSIKYKTESVIIKYVDRPVPIARYAYKYKDRENLIELQKKVDQLTDVALDSIFLQNNMKTRDQLIDEINSLREHENAVCLNLEELRKQYKNHDFGDSVTETYSYASSSRKLEYIKLNRELNEVRIFLQSGHYVSLAEEVFGSKHPIIYLTLVKIYDNIINDADANQFVLTNRPDPTIFLAYKDRRTYLNDSFFLDINNCSVQHGLYILRRENLLDKMGEIQLENLQKDYLEFDALVRNLNERIYSEQARHLIKVDTTDTSTHMMEFSIDESLLECLNSFLSERDKISFKIAANEGRDLPFEKYKIVSNKPQKNEMLIHNVSFSEDNGVLNMSDSLLSLIQNPALMFAAALTTITVHNFQTIELAAQALLGFVYIPAYNDAFIAATHLTINDLQTTYNLSQELAERADQILSFAYNAKYPETNWEINSNLSDSSADIPKTVGWNKLFIAGALIVGTIGVGYLTYQAIKTGAPVDTLISTIKNINPDV